VGVNFMRFSIDGFYEDKYNERRKGLNFKEVVKNTEYFCSKAKPLGVYTDVRMIGFPDSTDEQKLFVEKWSKVANKAEITSLYRYPWEGQTEVVYKPCLKIRKEMFFYVDGRATLCCWDTNERAVIGDVKEQKALDIWNGELAKKYRALLDAGQRDKITLCSRCDAYKDHKFE
ncbi:MAG: SPASM domain-containing protein, partial [Pseudomonadota bacterium]